MAKAFKPHLENKLVQEALVKIREKFESSEHVGPKWCADIDEIINEGDRAMRQRDAFERVNDLLTCLGKRKKTYKLRFPPVRFVSYTGANHKRPQGV